MKSWQYRFMFRAAKNTTDTICQWVYVNTHTHTHKHISPNLLLPPHICSIYCHSPNLYRSHWEKAEVQQTPLHVHLSWVHITAVQHHTQQQIMRRILAVLVYPHAKMCVCVHACMFAAAFPTRASRLTSFRFYIDGTIETVMMTWGEELFYVMYLYYHL